MKIYDRNIDKLANFHKVFVSPGVKKNHFLILESTKQKLPVINDIELFWEIYKDNDDNKNIVAVTGTNGKSTVALMISEAIRSHPLGNYGNPVLNYKNKKCNNYIIELSSFQLDYIKNFRPFISIITNIEKDHISHHESFKKYLNAKKNIYRNQNKNDYLILNYDNENIKKHILDKNKIVPHIIKVSNKTFLKKGISLINNVLYDNYFSNTQYII